MTKSNASTYGPSALAEDGAVRPTRQNATVQTRLNLRRIFMEALLFDVRDVNNPDPALPQPRPSDKISAWPAFLKSAFRISWRTLLSPAIKSPLRLFVYF